MGFFDDETVSKNLPGMVKGKAVSCVKCGLLNKCKTPKFELSGQGQKGILIIHGYPSKREDQTSRHNTSKSGMRLKQILLDMNVNIDQDCYSTHAVACKPAGELPPSEFELACCRRRLTAQIEELQPKLIIALGIVSLKGVIEHRWYGGLGSMDIWRGWQIPDQYLGCWLCPTYHPSTLEDWQNSSKELIFKQDLRRALLCLRKKFPVIPDPQDKVTIVRDEKEIQQLCKFAMKFPLVSVDFETTGLKPQAEGHRIVSMSYSVNADSAVSFPIPDTKMPLIYIKRLLASRRTKKMAHNMKFETTWAKAIWDCDITAWEWDSMLAAHLIDNREGITGLKFQVYVQFGHAGYDHHIKKYLKSKDEKNGNSMNKIHQANMTKLLLYGGLDSLWQFRLAMLQMKKIEKDIK